MVHESFKWAMKGTVVLTQQGSYHNTRSFPQYESVTQTAGTISLNSTEFLEAEIQFNKAS